MILSSRDSIIKILLKDDTDGSTLALVNTLDRPEIPIPNNTIRIDLWMSRRAY